MSSTTTTIHDPISAAQVRVVALCALVTLIEGIDLTLIPLLAPKITEACRRLSSESCRRHADRESRHRRSAAGEAPRVLVSVYEGTRFNRPNDLVASSRGNIYFTDTVPLTATKPPAMPSAVYQVTADGKLVRIAADIARPNGVALSPDDRTLYVANTTGDWVLAFPLDRKGHAKERRDFAKLALPPQKNGAVGGAGADGLAVDEEGRLYVATSVGVQVFSPKGEALGVIALPKRTAEPGVLRKGPRRALRGGERRGVSDPDADPRPSSPRQVAAGGIGALL